MFQRQESILFSFKAKNLVAGVCELNKAFNINISNKYGLLSFRYDDHDYVVYLVKYVDNSNDKPLKPSARDKLAEYEPDNLYIDTTKMDQQELREIKKKVIVMLDEFADDFLDKITKGYRLENYLYHLENLDVELYKRSDNYKKAVDFLNDLVNNDNILDQFKGKYECWLHVDKTPNIYMVYNEKKDTTYVKYFQTKGGLDIFLNEYFNCMLGGRFIQIDHFDNNSDGFKFKIINLIYGPQQFELDDMESWKKYLELAKLKKFSGYELYKKKGDYFFKTLKETTKENYQNKNIIWPTTW